MGLFTVQTSWGIPFISPAYMALTFAALIFSHIYLYVYDHVKDTGQMNVWDWSMDRFVDQLLLANFCAHIWKPKASREVVSSLLLIVVLRGFCYRPFWSLRNQPVHFLETFFLSHAATCVEMGFPYFCAVGDESFQGNKLARIIWLLKAHFHHFPLDAKWCHVELVVKVLTGSNPLSSWNLHIFIHFHCLNGYRLQMMRVKDLRSGRCHDTVDGSEIQRSPVEVGSCFPLFTRFHTSQGVSRISSINSFCFFRNHHLHVVVFVV